MFGFKGTPGPWSFHLSNSGRKAWFSGSYWSRFAKCYVVVGGKPSDEGMANARLIVSAPELFRLCAAHLAELDFIDTPTDAQRAERAELFAVLAKVAG